MSERAASLPRGAALLRPLALVALVSLLLGAWLSGELGRRPGRANASPPATPARTGLAGLPAQSRGAVSAALGAADAAYWSTGSRGALTADSPGERLSERFDSSGAYVRSGSARLSLRLSAFGYGGASRTLGAVAPRARANRVLYARAGLSEWYANGPLGLEQGFTVSQAPSSGQAGPLTLAIELAGNMRPALTRGDREVIFSGPAGSSLRYGGLLATDASGRTLRSWLALEGRRLLLRVDTRGAHFPLRIDPLIEQTGKLTASGESGDGQLGASVALSADGDTALVGAPADDGGVGGAWVFTRSGSTWTQQAKLTGGSEESGDGGFGTAVALSSDGEVALVGGPGDDGGVGGAWVFTRSGSTWTQQAKLTGGGEESGDGELGAAVALSADGEVALVGGPGDSSGVGAAWVFSGSGWADQAKLTASEESGAGGVGQSVALSSGGEVALVGGPGDSGGAGAAWVFSGSGWAEQSKLTAGEESGEGQLGASASLSADASVALVGAPQDDSGVGAAYAFTAPPIALTAAATAVAQTTATLNATVNPNGGEVSSCEFEYGTSKSYGSSVPCASLPGSGNSPVAVSAPLEALAADTTYHFRIVASGPGGTAVGLDETFKTLPSAPTLVAKSATAITQTGATLRATVNPNGGEVSSAHCRFEYGPTEAYGSSAACEQAPGAGTTPVEVTAAIEGLSADSAYYFRIVATNAGGASEAAGPQFETLPEAPVVATTPASDVGTSTATLNATVDPNGGEVSSCEFEYGASEAYGSSVACSSSPGGGDSPVDVSATLHGLTADTAYYYRISATNAGGKSTALAGQTFTTSANAPTTVTGSASSIAQTGATLNATVNPNGGEVLECRFEYGPTEAYGSNVPCDQDVGSGKSAVAVSASISALQADTTYHFRILARNAGGTEIGSDASFKTLPDAPSVLTSPASAVTQTEAKLNGTVDPNGGKVGECRFEYGPTDAYGSSAACTPEAGSGTSAVAVSATVKGLSPDAAYHFRIVAVNAGGTGRGSDESLRTLPDAPTVTDLAASSLSQAGATLSATVDPNGGEVSECRFEYGPTSNYGSSAACFTLPGSGTSGVEVSAVIAGLSADTTYHYRVVAVNPGGSTTSAEEEFTTLPNAPTVVTGKASDVAQAAATLNATVDPNGGEVGDCRFEYGKTEAYGSTASCQQGDLSGDSAVAVSASVSGLQANTTYHFRVLASNAGGPATGSDGTFTTVADAPTVVTKAASSLSQSEATLNATVNPNGSEVSECRFEYGTSKSYGSSVPCASSPGAGTSAVDVSAVIKGLSANTTYHYRIVAENGGGPSEGADESLTTLPDPPAVVTGKASDIAQTTATLGATVNPNGGVTECHFEYGATEAYGSSAPCEQHALSGSSPVSVSAQVSGLAADTAYHFRIVASNAGGPSTGGDATFTTLPDAPTVVSEPASAISQTGATLNATVNPNGGEVSECRFEYGPTTKYGSTVPCASSPGSGTSAVQVSAKVKGLSANTAYHYRVVATNAGGSSSGKDRELSTLPDPPTVVTGKAAAITQTAATLNATVNPNGGAVGECRFEYGATEAYGSSAPCEQHPGSGSSAVSVSAQLSGLAAGTTYHFRIVAENAGGPGAGSDASFETLPNPPTALTEAASSKTETSAVLNATVNPNGGEVSECHFEYGPTTKYGSSAPCVPAPGSGRTPVAVSAAVTGLKGETSYHFRVVATNAGGRSAGNDESFETSPGPPILTVEDAQEIKQTSAIMHATVNLRGGKFGNCYFTVFSVATLEQVYAAPCVEPGETGTVAVSALAEGLNASTAYYYILYTENNFAEGAFSEAKEFTTMPGPSVEPASPSELTQTTATLNATVNPNDGEVTECRFEYGPTTAYGTSVKCTPSPGSGASPVDVSAAVKGLTANTTYHFRTVAHNEGGTDDGPDRTFTTLPNAPSVVTGEASALTDDAATLSGTVDPNGGEVSAAHCRFEYGPTASYGSSVSCASSPGAGASAVEVSAAPSGLSAGTTYHFRLVAENAGGQGAGEDHTLTTQAAPAQPTGGDEQPGSSATGGVAGYSAAGAPAPAGSPLAAIAVSCRVTLASTKLAAALATGSVSVKLLSSGSGTSACAGKLTLMAKARGNSATAKQKSSKPAVLASGAFTLVPGANHVVRLKLSKLGRALLREGHGRLSATLAIFETAPGPTQTRTEAVHITPEVKARSSSTAKT